MSARDDDDSLVAILQQSLHPDRSGDVEIVLAPYWIAVAYPTTHGSPWDYDRKVPMLAYGRGICAGNSHEGPVGPGLIAVLAAALCGIEPPPGAVDPLPDGILSR